MLAEASAGGEDGLAELRALWEEGGEGRSKGVPAIRRRGGCDGEPGTKWRKPWNSDVSAEQAGQNLVNRTAIAVSDQVTVASFYVSGIAAADRFIAGLSSRSEAARKAGESISTRRLSA